jgi:hypothetical protein
MKTVHAGLSAFAVSALLALTGCASSQEWAEWRSHSTHFASGQHASFSLRNPGEQARHVHATDLPNAQAESWWGRALPMQEQGG